MRSDDIRAMVLDAHDRAEAVCRRVEASGKVPEIEIADYLSTLEATARFWRSASPAFIFAWYEATAAEVDEGGP